MSSLSSPQRKRPTGKSDLILPLAVETIVSSPCAENGEATSPPSPDRGSNSPRQQTVTLVSEGQMTESVIESSISEDSTCISTSPLKSKGGRRSSAPMRFLQKVMRSQSEGHIRIVPVPQNSSKINDSRQAEVALHKEKNCEQQCDNEDTTHAVDTSGDDVGRGRDLHIHVDDNSRLSEVFLSSSLQLLQIQSDTKQRIRQLWNTAQRLRFESQLSDKGLDALHEELLNVMKSLTIEKLDGTRFLKAGHLMLVQAPPSVMAASLLARNPASATKTLLFGGKSTIEQRVWVSISEEQCRLEIVPVQPELFVPVAQADPQSASTQPQVLPSMSGSATFPGLAKFKLPSSISWLLSDPLAQTADNPMVQRTTIKLQGCQARRQPSGVTTEPSRLRFQLLVPSRDIGPSSASEGHAAVVPEPPSPHTAFAIYVFEILDAESTEKELEDWLNALNQVCMFHLYMLQSQLKEATYMLQYRDILAENFPVCIPLTWLRNRLERLPIGSARQMSPQQQASYHQQQLQRRSSRNLSMIQIIKDLERDKILVDQHLLISCIGNQSSACDQKLKSTDPCITERDSVAEIVKYLVAKAMAFAKRTSSTHNRVENSPAKRDGSSSPSSRLTRFTEAKALAFVERVLRGSSRTQSGGDIYDAISFFCQQRHLSICPMSHDAHPVQMNVIEDDILGTFQVNIEVSMQFKVVELAVTTPRGSILDAPMVPREWAVIDGTLTREFTLGKMSEPGTVTVRYVAEATLDEGQIESIQLNAPAVLSQHTSLSD